MIRCLRAAVFAFVLVASGVAHARNSAIVIDYASGTVLHEENADALRFPASLTKMMTLYLLFDALEQGRVQLNTRLRVSPLAARQPRTRLGLRPGQTITVEQAILALITRSANDAAVVVAEGLAGSVPAFADAMTQRARALGMTQTRFRNASGLPDAGQVTTARDLARLAMALIRDHPQRYRLFATQSFSFAGRRFENHNRMLGWYDGMDGIKTGYIRDSGYNIAVSAVRGGRRLVAVVMGGDTARSRDEETADVLDAGFRRATTLPPAREVARPPRVAAAPPPPSPVPAPMPAALAPPAATAPPQPVTAVPRGADWGIQVGAFEDAARARTAAETARRAAGQPRGQVVVAPVDGGDLQRARVLALTERQAREACRRLDRRQQACIVLTPQDLVGQVRVASR